MNGLQLARRLKRLFVSAFQSEMFNDVLVRRLSDDDAALPIIDPEGEDVTRHQISMEAEGRGPENPGHRPLAGVLVPQNGIRGEPEGDGGRKGHQHGGHMSVPLGIFQSIGIRNSNQKLADELHFADFAPDGSLADPRANVAVAIRLSYRALADPVSNPMQRGEALAYLVHCLGDAHQPLHCGWAADLGGTTITILGLGRSHARTELHAVFDSGLIRSTRIRQPADYARERLEPLIPKFEGRALASLDPTTWIQESHQLALEDAYVDENGTLVQNGAILSLAYERRGLLIVDQRLAEAGIRLAALLKPALGRPIP